MFFRFEEFSNDYQDAFQNEATKVIATAVKAEIEYQEKVKQAYIQKTEKAKAFESIPDNYWNVEVFFFFFFCLSLSCLHY